MENKMNRTLLNGRKYEFVEWMIFGHTTVSSYCEWNGRMNKIGLRFNNRDEAKEWCDKMDEEYLHPTPVIQHTMRAEDYYSITGYYGD